MDPKSYCTICPEYADTPYVESVRAWVPVQLTGLPGQESLCPATLQAACTEQLAQESHSVETDLQIDFNPSAVWAFVPARSCHLHLSGPHGTFSPPIFYGNIHVNLWCNWTIMAAPERHIVIYITGFQTNKSCSENHDEIIFEGVSSSVENTIVYACWNKHTHVFATKALAVSVVLLWRSFANTGSNRYFYGRYYVFNDPVLGPNIDSGNCSLVSKQNVSTSAIIQPPIPDETPTTKSHLDSVFPESSSSEMFRSIPYSPETSYPQVPPTVMETYISTPTNDHLLTTTTHGDDMLHVTRSSSQTLSTMYYSSESPVMIQSLELGVLEDHTVGDLEPSHIGKWETMSQSTWTTAGSEFFSETPSLISAQNTEFPEAAHLGVISWMVETKMFTEDRSAIVQTQNPSSPQNLEVKVDEQLTIESTVASHPIPEIPTELTYHKNMLEFTEITDKMETIDEYTIVRDLETQSLPTIDHKYTQSLVEPMEELDWWTVTGNLEATDSISTTSTHPLSTPPSYLYFSRELRNTFSNAPEDIKPQVTPSPNSPQPAHNLKPSMDITTRGLFSEGNEKSTYSYQTNSDLDFYPNAAGQPRGGYLDKQDVIYFFDNESGLGVLHKPGDSLYVITTEIEDKDVVWKGSEEDLVQSISEKITERMIYYPSGANSLVLKEIRSVTPFFDNDAVDHQGSPTSGWSNVNKVKLTFWLQLFQGGKEMRNFLKTQLKALEGYPFGSSNATLISYTVDDLNECQLGIENCHSNAHCVNTVGSYSCVCMDGYEDHSPDASGTSCIAAKSAEINSLSEHLEIVIGVIVTVAVTLLFIIITLSVVQYKRRAKVNFSLQDPPTREPEAHIGAQAPADEYSHQRCLLSLFSARRLKLAPVAAVKPFDAAFNQ
ncbi:unnamed protein product [Ranitomeya imitator]|uniref:EGF-like domain-containing protein n=1 Tax=Ranitomeya imitator TaxID=111125 RepID=A0ABN9LXF4_9NEOB|nr:unnamed protein product [Ranitomeya imitator]